MNIIIEDNNKKTCSKAGYVATFPSAEHPPFTSYQFPVETDPANAEQMLHVLNAMCYHPGVKSYLRAHIPFPFFTAKKVRNRHIPLEPLLNYLAGPSNIHWLEWNGQHIEYSKSSRGLVVKQYSKSFIFSYHNYFTDAFIETFGADEWENAFYQHALTEWEFCNAAENVAAILSPFESWFVSGNVYDRLCNDLQSICMRLEALVDQSVFTWQARDESQAMLVNIIKEKSGSFTDPL